MLTIDRLSLRLPPGFEHRASGIVTLIGAQLAALPLPKAARVNRLRVEHVLAGADASDEAIAGAVAVALARQLRSRRRAGRASYRERG